MNPQVDQDNEDVVLMGGDYLHRELSNEKQCLFALNTIRNARWLYYLSYVWADYTKYLGIETMKFPTDMWVMQELIYEIKPDFLIETGTWRGGSALFYAHIMDAIGHGKVITIDNDPKDNLPKHDRIQYLVGDCMSKEILNSIHAFIDVRWVNGKGPIMVNLDSAHYKYHVLKEMELYGKFVTYGSYMVVEDGIVGHPVMVTDNSGDFILPGPYEAINEFLRLHPEFESDRSKEKFQIIANIKGYLKKVMPNG